MRVNAAQSDRTGIFSTVGLANAKVLWQSALNQSEVYLAQSRRSGPIAVR